MTGKNETENKNSPKGISAIILAGGNSSRMKMDKALLPVSGTRLIQKVANDIGAHCDEIIISAQREGMYDFLPYPVVADKTPGQGPLMGILSGLKASSNAVNFVVACDIPVINIEFMLHLKQFTRDYEIVVPVTSKGFFEPLFAFYNKDLIPRIETLLEKQTRKVIRLYPQALVKVVPMQENKWYHNLNTEEDYQQFLEREQ